MADKKVFDIVHPEKTPSVSEKPKKIMLQEPKDEDSQVTGAPEVATMQDTNHVSRRGMTLNPVSDSLEPEEKSETLVPKITEQPVAESAPLPPSPIQDEAAEEPEEEPETEQAPAEEALKVPETVEDTKEDTTATPVKESFGMTDVGLDDSQRATAAVKETMQDPKIYDTKAYYVPIGNTHHKHGHVAGAVFAGLFAAAAAVGAVFYITQGL